MSARILVVEDEEALTTLLRYNLEAEGYEVETVARGDDVLLDAQVRVAFVSGGRARPIPKALRLAMRADQSAPAGGGPSR